MTLPMMNMKVLLYLYFFFFIKTRYQKLKKN